MSLKSHCYTAFGLCIHSSLSLPELAATRAAPDVILGLDNIDRTPPARAIVGKGWWATDQEVCLYYDQLGAVLVRDGREMLVDAAPGLQEQALRGLILGAALAVLLHQRGLLVLHASAVDLGGTAVAFLGDAGWGKSTAAAALHARGCGVIADDVVALAWQNQGSPAVLPAFPRLKLWPKVVASLGQDPDVLPRVYPGEDKRVYRATDGFPQAPVPLGCIYVLDGGTCTEIEPLGSRDAFVQLVRHSYAVHLLQATGTASRHFRQCVQLADSVPVSRLTRQQSLAFLPDLVRLIEAHSADCLSGSDLPSRLLKGQRVP